MNDIKAVFDIGNETIKAVVFGQDNDKDAILAKHSEPVMGMRKGKIIDAEAFTTTLNKIVETFIKKLWGDFIDKVYIWVSHPELLVQRIVEGKRIMTDEVETADLDHLSRIVADIAHVNNYEIMKIVPVARIVDEDKKEKDPVGLHCKKLELMADVFLLPKNFYTGLIDAFDKIWLEIADIIPNILAASEVAIDYDHKDLWTVLVDIGKNQTSYVIYEDGFPLWYGTIPLGGENVTKDISIGMQVDIKESEEIKKTLGTVYVDEKTQLDSPMDVYFLAEIISARYEQIFDKINIHLKSLEKDGRLPGGVLLIWWGSKMRNLDVLSKNTFKLASFLGGDQVVNFGELSHNLQFVNLLWCYHWSQKYIEEGRGFGNWFWEFGKIGKKIWSFFKNLF